MAPRLLVWSAAVPTQRYAGRGFCHTSSMDGDRDEEQDGEQDAGPSLEPPSLFRRKPKKKRPVDPPAPAPAPEPVREPEPTVRLEPVRPAPPATPTPAARPVARPRPDPAPEPAPEPAPVLDTPREPRAPREPWLVGPPAAALTGLLVGALIVALTGAGLRACSAVQGTSSCGGSGFFLLVAILVVAVLVGAALLRAARAPQPGSTSFLAVGLLSIVALLFLVGSLFEWWMLIVIPTVSVLAYLLSHWVTTTYIEPDDDASDPELEPEVHDVR